MLQLPSSGSHPVLFARRLLLLGTFLQGVPPKAMQKLGGLGASYLEIMANAVDKAVRLVNTNDSLTCSFEGLECIMIEAKYHNYSGQLYKSFMATRRAVAVAQAMALHRGFKSPSLKFLEFESRNVFNPNQITFKLVEMDTYLSMMLGVPPSPIEMHFASDKALEDCHPIDRMERIFMMAGKRILQRNATDITDLSVTWDIDKTLQKAVNEISSADPQWWLDPTATYIPLAETGTDGSEILSNAIRTADQLWFYHLLIRLHLPHMLRPSTDHKFMPNKLAVVHASRETLSRYNSFRISNPAEYYCRGSDYLALVAFTMLCLAYISSASQTADLGATVPDALVQFLAHNRPSARGIMEQTLQILESISKNGTDSIALDISRAMRSLLTTEANAASGVVYKTSSSNADDMGFENSSRISDANKALQIRIAHFGTINFEHGVVSKSTSLPETSLMAEESGPSIQSAQGSSLAAHHVFSRHDVSERHLRQPSQQTLGTGEICYFQHMTSDSNVSIPTDLPDIGDEWGGVQEVDIALFDSIFRGLDDPAVTEDAWPQWMNV